jgi:queuosine precursor transporter
MRQYRYLGIITILYVTFQLVSDVSAGKLISLFGFPVSVTVIFFPVTYVLADVLTEVYGYAKARAVVWQVVIASITAGILYQLVARLPPAAAFDADEAYRRVFFSVPRILLGGWIAVWAGGISNDYVLAKMKIWTRGRYLWTRTIGSTLVGEFFNTSLFYVIALGGVLPQNVLIAAILTGWLFKVVVEVVLTPWTYFVIRKLKAAEQEDFYDYHTNFNPFVLTDVADPSRRQPAA